MSLEVKDFKPGNGDKKQIEELCSEVTELLGFVNAALTSPKLPDVSSAVSRNEMFSEIHDYLTMVRKSMFSLAKGKIEFSIEQKGFLAGCLKELQSNMRHLTWFAERLGEGDFEQSLDFLGDFSSAFNALNGKFRNTIDALKASEANLRKLTDELYTNEERWKLAIACTQDGVWDVDLRRGEGYFSSRMWEILRRPVRSDRIFFSERYWMRYVHPDDREKLRSNIMEAASKIGHDMQRRYSEFRLRCGDGQYRWVGVHHMLILDNNGDPFRMVGACEDIQERRQREDAIRDQATHDKLTGLPNRYLYADRLSQQMVMAKRNESSLVLIVWDLDGFKAVNDTYGHLAGDALLVAVADVMKSSLRETDTVARFGGDEFVMILSSARGHEREVASLITGRIFEALKPMINLDGIFVQIGASGGISFFPGHSSDSTELFNMADKALYHAKRHGKNMVCEWTPDLDKAE
ncbi:MAG: diguanylate cyclase [Synergistaceae bacterium]|jgi:diguanylate cyclase (GGDEF)-like protein|nr:diguanylate cyclase [Synergistaceae bacterium]